MDDRHSAYSNSRKADEMAERLQEVMCVRACGESLDGRGSCEDMGAVTENAGVALALSSTKSETIHHHAVVSRKWM